MILSLISCTANVLPPPDTSPPVDSEVPVDSVPARLDETGLEYVPGLPELVPVLWLDPRGSISDSEKTEGELELIRPTDADLDNLDDDPRSLVSDMGIQVHGSSSRYYDKQGYRLELRDSQGNDQARSMMGLPLGSDFVLHAPYSDKTLVRNAFAYRMGRAVAGDAGPWQPRTRFVELFIDGDYEGVYVLTERVRRDGDRVDIAQPAASAGEGDLSGGYIVRIEQHRNEGWDTSSGTKIDYHYPRYEDISSEQDAWLKAWFESFEAALMAEDWKQTYPDWLVVEDWIDHYIVNEMAHNIDAYRLSAYLYKDAEAEGGRLHAGPLWDFDRAFGNVNYCDCENIEGFIIDDLTHCGEGYQYPFWWKRLLSDPAFTAQLRCRYEELRGEQLSDAELERALVELTAELEHAEPRDHQRWDTIGTHVDPNSWVGESYEEEVALLLDWQLRRAAWLDANMPGTCAR